MDLVEVSFVAKTTMIKFLKRRKGMDRCYLALTVCAGAKKRLYLVRMNSLLLETLQDKFTS